MSMLSWPWLPAKVGWSPQLLMVQLEHAHQKTGSRAPMSCFPVLPNSPSCPRLEAAADFGAVARPHKSNMPDG
jgi:hypothetical protein